MRDIITQNETYIFVLDFSDGKCYRYNYKADFGKVEEFIRDAGHSVSDCEYMITKNPIVMYDYE